MTEAITNRIIEFTRHLNPYELREEIEEEVLNTSLSALIAGLEAVAQDEEQDEEVRKEAEDILQEIEGKGKEENTMKTFELRIKYNSGEIDDYYTRLTGKGWETDAETAEEALQEMKENDPETFESMSENVESFWAEEIQPKHKTIRFRTSTDKASAIGKPCRSSAGVMLPLEVNLSAMSPAAAWVAGHITSTYVADEVTDKCNVYAESGDSMADRDRKAGKSEKDIESMAKCYGDDYTSAKMRIRVTFPYYGKRMLCPEEVIEEAVEQCIKAGTKRFICGKESFTVSPE